MTGSFRISLFEDTLHVDKINVWFKITNITHALLVPVYRQTDFPLEQVDVSRLHDTVAKSRPGVTTGVTSRQGDSHRHDILWWHHVNKCRALRGNRSELAAARKSPWCHVKTPLQYMIHVLLLLMEFDYRDLLDSRTGMTTSSRFESKFFRVLLKNR